MSCVDIHLLTYSQPALPCIIGLLSCIFLNVIGVKGHVHIQ